MVTIKFESDFKCKKGTDRFRQSFPWQRLESAGEEWADNVIVQVSFRAANIFTVTAGEASLFSIDPIIQEHAEGRIHNNLKEKLVSPLSSSLTSISPSLLNRPHLAREALTSSAQNEFIIYDG